MMVHPMASPSSPSVRFTALLVSVITSITNTTNGRYAIQCICGMWPNHSHTRSGRNFFTNGTISRVE